MAEKVVLVTGGTGLVGKGIEAHIQENAAKHANEKWIYLSSKDGDLRKIGRYQKNFREVQTNPRNPSRCHGRRSVQEHEIQAPILP
jgi:FlaA1/EpsC-like NDP-sugar epimerase